VTCGIVLGVSDERWLAVVVGGVWQQ